jgi:hypothetical protein
MVEYKNKAEYCKEDPLQVIVNNQRGSAKEIRLQVTNRGECEILIGNSTTRSTKDPDWDQLGPQFIPAGASEDVYHGVPAGKYVKASCSDDDRQPFQMRCDWTITTY